MRKIAIVSGGFDPVHIGHIELFNKSKHLLGADELIAILNSDDFLVRKKGEYFMPYEERCAILENLRMINLVFGSVDPEHEVCAELGMHTIYGLGDKIQSSSWLLQ